MAVAALFAPFSAVADGYVVGCGATAPLTPYCSTGWHVYDSAHDEASIYVEAYTGTVESTLRHPGGERIYSCSFLAGVRQRCDWLGQEPPGGTLVYHTCDSYSIPIMYGGVGSYACSLH